MRKKIEFREMPDNDMTYMGLISDKIVSVIVDDIPIGIAYLSEGISKGYERNTAYIEWIEFLYAFRSKHMLKPVMDKLCAEYGELIFESSNELHTKYKAIGAIETGYDKVREMHSWRYVA